MTLAPKLPSFNERALDKEIMDEGHYTQEEFAECLVQLDKINDYTQGHTLTLKGIEYIIEKSSKNPIHIENLKNLREQFEALHFHSAEFKAPPLKILDIGYGSGGTLQNIWEWAEKKQIDVELEGIDLNGECFAFASERLQAAHTPAQLFLGDGSNHLLTHEYDIVVCSLLTHHLENPEVVALVRKMTNSARLGWVINDLHRHRLPYYFTKFLFKFLEVNRLIKNDALLSIQKSFKKPEWLRLLEDAGLDQSHLHFTWMWSFRYGIFYTK